MTDDAEVRVVGFSTTAPASPAESSRATKKQRSMLSYILTLPLPESSKLCRPTAFQRYLDAEEESDGYEDVEDDMMGSEDSEGFALWDPPTPSSEPIPIPVPTSRHRANYTQRVAQAQKQQQQQPDARQQRA